MVECETHYDAMVCWVCLSKLMASPTNFLPQVPHFMLLWIPLALLVCKLIHGPEIGQRSALCDITLWLAQPLLHPGHPPPSTPAVSALPCSSISNLNQASHSWGGEGGCRRVCLEGSTAVSMYSAWHCGTCEGALNLQGMLTFCTTESPFLSLSSRHTFVLCWIQELNLDRGGI